MKKIGRVVKLVFEGFVFVGISYLILGITYYFGWTLLLPGIPWGNDVPSAVQSILYLDHWFPSIPAWNYLWTGGMPSFNLYPPMSFYLTYFLHRLSQIPIMEMAHLYLFICIAVSGAGVALLGRVITKNWFVGLIAGVLMLLSPDTWLWTTMGGFYAVASSVPIFIFSLVFFVAAMERKTPLFYTITAFFYGLLWTFHPMAGMLVTLVFGILGLGYSVQEFGWKNSWKGLTRVILIGISGVFLFAWWIFPFLRREEIGGIGLGVDQMYKTSLWSILGLEAPAESFITGTLFTSSAIILFVLGSITAFLRRSILRWAVIACLMGIFIASAPYFAKPIVEKLLVFWTATNVRSLVILRIFGPIIGAYGAISLIRPFFWIAEKIFKKLKTNFIWSNATQGLGGIFGLVVFFVLVRSVIFIPAYLSESNIDYSGFGPLRHWLITQTENGKKTVTNSTNGEQEPLFKDQKTIIAELPQMAELIQKKPVNVEHFKTALELGLEASGVTDKDRIDIIPTKGEYAGVLGLYSQVSEVPTYMGTSLIQSMWGWEVDCMYWNKVCGPQQIEDLARWWGISQVWLAGIKPEDIMARFDQSPLFRFETHEFKQPGLADIYYWNLYRFTDVTGLASISNRPAVLIIGNNPPNNDVYDIVFRGLTKVDFGYKDAWSVRGKQFVDDYTLVDLTQYEGIILHGYRYHNRVKAWDLLDKYVRQGGSLMVNTGWQYNSQDWGVEVGGKIQSLDMPKLLPVKKTTWQKIDQREWNLAIGSDPILDGVTANDWGEPLYFEKPWGVAAANQSDLRDGATILLTNDKQVLSASWLVGKGKVVWTGFDYWGHLTQYKAEDERKMVRKMLSWLVGRETIETKLDFARITPDNVSIKFEKLEGKNKVMFKEVASQNWRASLKDQNSVVTYLPIVKAGPGWKMVFIPDRVTSGEVIFSYHRVGIENFGIVISLLTALLSILWIVAHALKKDIAITEKVHTLIDKHGLKLKKDWADEEN